MIINFILLIILTAAPSVSTSSPLNIFNRLDNSKEAVITEFACDNETVTALPFAEICEMRDGGILSFSPFEICKGYPGHPDCTYGNIQVFNRSSAVYIKHHNRLYTVTNTHLLYNTGTRFNELKNRDLACYRTHTMHYPYTNLDNAVLAEPDMNITSTQLNNREVIIYGIVDNIIMEIKGTAFFTENGLTKTRGEISITGVSNTNEYLKRRLVMNVPARDWHGLSGAPVFYRHKLVGIVSSGADTFITFTPPEDIQLLLNQQN